MKKMKRPNKGFAKPSSKLKKYLISTAAVKKMQRNYKAKQLNTLHIANGYIVNSKKKKNAVPTNGFHETLSVWFPIEVLEEYLKFIQLRFAQAAIDKSGKISGVRINISAYSDPEENSEEYNLDTEEKFRDENSRLTAIMVPTIKYSDLGDCFSRKDIEKFPHLQHVPVYLNKVGRNKVIQNLDHHKPGDKNEKTGLMGKPFPPPPQGG